MTKLQNKIDFAAVLCVNRANANGDPLNGNRPRTDYNGYGEMSDVCIKRKIRTGCRTWDSRSLCSRKTGATTDSVV